MLVSALFRVVEAQAHSAFHICFLRLSIFILHVCVAGDSTGVELSALYSLLASLPL